MIWTTQSNTCSILFILSRKSPAIVKAINVKFSHPLLRINKFLEISPSTAFKARAVTGR